MKEIHGDLVFNHCDPLPAVKNSLFTDIIVWFTLGKSQLSIIKGFFVRETPTVWPCVQNRQKRN